MKAAATDNVVDELAGWFTKLSSGTATPADQRAFEAWLDDAPGRREAAGDLTAILAELDFEYGDEQADGVLFVENATPGRREGLRQPWSWRSAARWRPAWLLSAAAACVAVVVSIGWGLGAFEPEPVAVRTAVGQQRQIALADGSRVVLNTDTALDYRIDRRTRAVQLISGEAFFRVAKNAEVPFVVSAPQGAIKVVGTAFNVRTVGSETTVAVEEGVVEVKSADGDGASQRLRPGDRARLTAGRILISRASVAPGSADAWTRRQLVYQDQPLHAVVADLDRYFPDRLVVTGAGADIRISAVINLADQTTVLDALSKQLPIRVSRGDPGVTSISVLPEAAAGS